MHVMQAVVCWMLMPALFGQSDAFHIRSTAVHMQFYAYY
jgi:hypothetical protein